MQAKNIIIAVLALVLLGAVGYLFLNSGEDTVVVIDEETTDSTPENDMSDQMPVEPDEGIGDGAEPLPEDGTQTRGDQSVLGTSAGGNDITSHHFGNGDTEILFVGGIHGGYSWNTVLLGYELIDYLDANPDLVPEDVTVTVIPVLNPDGLETTVGTTGRFSPAEATTVSNADRVAGRFNANEVDLNRNFDCEWSETGTWQNRTVSGGSAPFSEPEAAAMHEYINTYDPATAVVWFSAEGKVYPSSCDGIPSDAAVAVADTFASAAGYPTESEFDAYTITGDMVNWFAKQEIPAISVLLSDHESTEWSKNKAGVEALLNTYAN